MCVLIRFMCCLEEALRYHNVEGFNDYCEEVEAVVRELWGGRGVGRLAGVGEKIQSKRNKGRKRFFLGEVAVEETLIYIAGTTKGGNMRLVGDN